MTTIIKLHNKCGKVAARPKATVIALKFPKKVASRNLRQMQNPTDTATVIRAKDEQLFVSPRTSKPSMREGVADVLARIFTFERGDGWKSVVAFVAVFISFGWFADSALSAVQAASKWIFGRWLIEPVAQSILPVLIFSAVILLLVMKWRKSHSIKRFEAAVPLPHRGLIVTLSPYTQKDSLYADASQVEIAIKDKTLNLDSLLKATNWGPPAFAVAYHAPNLMTCWVIKTKKVTDEQAVIFTSLLDYIVDQRAGRSLISFIIGIEDENDIGETAQTIQMVYRRAKSSSIKSSDIIADFTSGTSAMSGGMILATLREDQNVEYIRRGVELSEASLGNGDVQKQRIIISPRTTRHLIGDAD